MVALRKRGPPREALPEHITDNDGLARRFRVSLATALSQTVGESEWKKIAMLHGLESQISNHPRFLRSLQWNDPDFEGHVIDLVDHLYERDQGVLCSLFLRDDVQRWLKRNDEDVLNTWAGEGDPLIDALSHGIEELEAAKGSIDLGEYSRRIQEALPNDPKLAVGATKEMLEATMRTILHARGMDDTEKLDFPTLTTRCMYELGLLPTTPPSSKAEGLFVKLPAQRRQ